MPVYLGLYKISTNLPPPPTPSDEVKQPEAKATAINMRMQSGDIKELHAFLDSGGGYYISADISPERLQQITSAWFPRATFEIHQTIPTEKATQNAINAARMRAGMR